MKWKQATCVLLVLLAVTTHSPAQPTSKERLAFEQTKSKAEKGDRAAQYSLGILFAEGKEVEQDYNEAVKWYRKAADQGDSWAQHNLGVCYYFGRGVPQDYVQAVNWYRKAAEQNAAMAQVKMGSCYANGHGVTKDPVEAAKWYRKAAEQNYATAQFFLAICYADGDGVPKDRGEALKWYRKSAEMGLAQAQCIIAACYAWGDDGIAKDEVEAVKWYQKAAAQNYAEAEYSLGVCYSKGQGVTKDAVEAVKLYQRAAEQGHAMGQYQLGRRYYFGDGVLVDYSEAVKWNALAAAQGYEDAVNMWNYVLREKVGPEQITEGQRRAAAFKPKTPGLVGAPVAASEKVTPQSPSTSGSGFFITDSGHLISNYHLVKDAVEVHLVTSAGTISAKIVRVDAANDLALLKADGRFAALPLAASRGTKLGSTVATVGFPNIGLQGFAPKLAKGEIASLSGAGDDGRYFQISVPVQPGNSGGALVNEHGNVVGVVSAKLNASAALAMSGTLPENVNYAVKSSYLLSFLESVPEVAAKLKEPSTKEKKFEDVVKEAEQAAVLVLVY